jgi:acyl-CoA hydrolase
MGTMLSHDRAGVSVLALYSQYKGRSRIVPLLEKGTVITVPRSLVDYVATEWGLVRSRGLTINERACALIRIAHPDHRENLMREAVDRGFVPYRMAAGDKLPRGVVNCR